MLRSLTGLIFKKYKDMLMMNSFRFQIKKNTDLGTFIYTKSYEELSSFDDVIYLPVCDSFTFSTPFNDNDKVHSFNGLEKKITITGQTYEIQQKEEVTIEELSKINYCDVTDSEILKLDEIVLSELTDKNAGLSAGIGRRKIKLELCQEIYDGIESMKFEWVAWDGTKELKSNKLKKEFEIERGPEKGVFFLWIDTDLIQREFFSDFEGTKVRFVGEITIERGGTKYKETFKFPFDLYMQLPSEESDFVSVDFGSSSTCVAKKGRQAELIPLDHILEEGNRVVSWESPTAIMVFDWEEIHKNYVANTSMPHLIKGSLTDNKTSDFTHGQEIINYLKNRHIPRKELEAIILNLKHLPYQESISKKGHFEFFRSVRSSNPNRPEIKLTSNPAKQNEESFDPIAFYAYVLGRSINRGRKGKFFTKYKVTMPVQFTSEIRNKIIASIQFGFKKALPLILQEQINVGFECTEPVAYMGSVLDQRENPDKECISWDTQEPKLFAVYDFGGGTLDFCAGMWRLVNDEDKDNLSYNDTIIEIFDQGGNVNLGGEKLINKISYKLFINNIATMAEYKIPLNLPDDYTWTEKARYENILKNSGGANLIMLSEKISREIFHKFDIDAEDKIVEVQELVDINGASHTVELRIGTSEILNDIKDEIFNSVSSFRSFIEGAMNKNRVRLEKYGINKYDMKEVFIYLSGNTSKSTIVHEAFKEYFQDCYDQDEGKSKRINFINNEHEGAYGITPKTAVALGQIQFALNNVGIFYPHSNGNHDNLFAHNLLILKNNRFIVCLSSNVAVNDWVSYGTNNDWSEKEMYYTQHPKPETLEPGSEAIKRSAKLSRIIKSKNSGELWVKPHSKSKIEVCLTLKGEKPGDDTKSAIFDIELKD